MKFISLSGQYVKDGKEVSFLLKIESISSITDFEDFVVVSCGGHGFYINQTEYQKLKKTLNRYIEG